MLPPISFFCYETGRSLFSLGFRVRPILKALDLPEEKIKILDAACGFGYFYRHVRACDYTGIDNDPERIGWAKSLYGENENRRFLLGDVCDTGLPSKSFDRGVGYGILHHLDDEQVKRFLAEINRLVKGPIVFSDPVYSRYHVINNLLCRMDRGRYVRRAEAYLDLCRPFLEIKKTEFFYARNGLAKFFLMTCLPKKGKP